MGQSITLRIGQKDYPLKASSPEAERYMRLAAESINAMLRKYDDLYPKQDLLDKMTFVALQQTVSKLSAQQELASMKKEIEALVSETGSYLSGIDKK